MQMWACLKLLIETTFVKFMRSSWNFEFESNFDFFIISDIIIFIHNFANIRSVAFRRFLVSFLL